MKATLNDWEYRLSENSWGKYDSGFPERRDYADGTYLTVSYPWGLYCGGAALCPDGRVRRLKRIASTADTFFSIPASVTVRGKTVAGYVTVETREGYSVATDTDPAVLKFRAYKYRKNGNLLA